ncbi:MAG: 23S rRNA (guanosine(2251)-2'-O)-methyltransferase RlmB [Pseudomonadales bacterium]|nr:23S rRNA (guanosine(2251)-2'-O)-methyltransferase RlmB [Pseudomonadales bacterium]
MAQTIVVYGLHTLTALMQRRPEQVLEVFLLQGREDERIQSLVVLATSLGVALHWRRREQLDVLCGSAQHQGAVARVREPESGNEHDLDDLLSQLKGPAFLLFLDGVTDPHNLGACLRTADAAGVHAVVAPRDRAGGLSPAARKVAVGAAEVLPFFQITNLARTLNHVKDAGMFLVGLAREEGASNLYECDLKGSLGLVLGAEGGGLRRLTRERCDTLAFLPMHGSVESLNVSVAAGIAMYEALRQRS